EEVSLLAGVVGAVGLLPVLITGEEPVVPLLPTEHLEPVVVPLERVAVGLGVAPLAEERTEVHGEIGGTMADRDVVEGSSCGVDVRLDPVLRAADVGHRTTLPGSGTPADGRPELRELVAVDRPPQRESEVCTESENTSDGERGEVR